MVLEKENKELDIKIALFIAEINELKFKNLMIFSMIKDFSITTMINFQNYMI